MKLSNGKEVKLYSGCILETEHRLYILCHDNGHYRLLDMENGKLDKNRYSNIKLIENVLDSKFRRIVYDGVVEPEQGQFIDVDIKETLQ